MIVAGCGPCVREFDPSAARPPESVTIKGSYFDGEGTVTFMGQEGDPGDDVDADVIDTWTDTEIEVNVPTGARSGKVQVTTAQGRSGESDYDFTVVSGEPCEESEPNDSIVDADEAGLAGQIVGKLTAGTVAKHDWFQVRSGEDDHDAMEEDLWYTLEFFSEAINPPQGIMLQLELCDMNDTGSPETLATIDGNKSRSWVTFPPESSIYLHVTWVGSAPPDMNLEYRIDIARIKVEDTNEGDDRVAQAKSLDWAELHEGSYLCDRYDPLPGGGTGSNVGLVDWYEIPQPQRGQTITISVWNAGLRGADNNVQVYLYNEQHDLVEQVIDGTGHAATLTYTVPDDVSPSGPWYVEVTNGYDEDHYVGEGIAPLNHKRPYSIMATVQ